MVYYKGSSPLPSSKINKIMRIVIEDYNGDYLCELNIDTLNDLYDMDNLIDCDIADIDTDSNGNDYVRLQINNI